MIAVTHRDLLICTWITWCDFKRKMGGLIKRNRYVVLTTHGKASHVVVDYNLFVEMIDKLEGKNG